MSSLRQFYVDQYVQKTNAMMSSTDKGEALCDAATSALNCGFARDVMGLYEQAKAVAEEDNGAKLALGWPIVVGKAYVYTRDFQLAAKNLQEAVRICTTAVHKAKEVSF